MATRTWSGAASSDLNSAGNYDGAGALLATDDLVFNSGAIGATASADLSVNSVTTTSDYSGAWSISGFNLTVAQGASFDHTGTLNLGNSLTANGASASVHVGSGVGAVTASSCAITLSGTTGMTFNIEKGITAKSLTLSASAVVTSTSAALSTLTLSNSATPFILGNSSSYTQNMRTEYTATGSCDLFSIGTSVTWAGTKNVVIFNNSSSTVNIPAVTYSGSGRWYISNSVNNTCTTVLTGNIDLGFSALITIYNSTSGALVHTVNLSTFNVSCDNLKVGNLASYVNNNLTVNYGSGTHSIAKFDITANSDGNDYNGLCTQNFNTAQITCKGGWVFGSNFVVDPGTSIITFTTTGASAVTSAGKTFYDITVNNASKVFSFADAVSLHNLTTTAMTSYTHAGFVLTASGNITFDGVGTLNLGNGITMTGNSKTFHIDANVGTVTATSCAIIINGTTVSLLINKVTHQFKSIALGASSSVTNDGLTTLIFSSATTPFSMGANSSLVFNMYMSFTITGAVDAYSVGAGCSLTGTYRPLFYTSSTVSLPALTSSTGLYFANSNIGGTYNMSGNITSSSNIIIVGTNNSALTFNTTDFSISCATFNPTGSQVGGAIIINLGASNISCSFCNINPGLASTATFVINMQTCSITCTGDFTYTSTGTCSMNPNTFQITFTGTGASIVTLNGKSLYDVTVNNASKAFSFFDTPSLHNLTVTAMASYTHTGLVLTASGNISFDGSGTLNLGNGITMSGASATFSISATVGVVTGLSCTLTMNGTTGMTLTILKTMSLKALVLGNNAIVVNNSGGVSTTLAGSTTLFTMGTGSSYTTNSYMNMAPSSSMTLWSLGSGYSFVKTGTTYIQMATTAPSLTITIPGITITGGSTSAFYVGSGGANCTVNITGIIDIGTMSLSPAGLMTFNTNDNNITCGAYTASGFSMVNNWGNSTVNISSYSSTGITAATSIENFQRSQWVCAGSWAFGSSHTINHAWDLITFSNTASITSNGKSFNWLKINASGKTVTLADNLVCRAYQNVAGTLNQNSKQFAVTGDYVEVTNSSS